VREHRCTSDLAAAAIADPLAEEGKASARAVGDLRCCCQAHRVAPLPLNLGEASTELFVAAP